MSEKLCSVTWINSATLLNLTEKNEVYHIAIEGDTVS